MKTKYLALAIAAPVIFVSCENPADKTTDAKVSDAVEKSGTEEAGGTKYVFTPASQVNFVGSKVTGSHPGGFKTFTGHFTIKDGAPVGTDHKVVLDMSSTFTDADKLTTHLKSPDFFDVKNSRNRPLTSPRSRRPRTPPTPFPGISPSTGRPRTSASRQPSPRARTR